MSYEDKVIDGLNVSVPVVNVTAATGWEASKDTMINLMALGESPNYFYDDFTDADAASGENFEHDAVNKCLKNTIIPAQPGGFIGDPTSLIPAMTANSSGGFVVSASSEYSGRPAYCAFDDNAVTSWRVNSSAPWWYQIERVAGQMIVTGFDIQDYYATGAAEITARVSDDGVSWSEVFTASGLTWSDSELKTFNVTTPTAGKYFKFDIASGYATGALAIAQMKLYGYEADGEGNFPIGEAAPAIVNPSIITLDNYIPSAMPASCKIKLWLENVDDGSVTPDLGNSGSNKIECYISTDGGNTFSSALSFTQATLQPAPDVFVFDSDEINLAGATGIQVKLHSFERGGSAPNFKWHAFLALEKEEG